MGVFMFFFLFSLSLLDSSHHDEKRAGISWLPAAVHTRGTRNYIIRN